MAVHSYYSEMRDIPEAERKDIPDSDFAGKGTSFPIREPEDVDAAARAIGRAGAGNYSADELKRNIMRIAKRKGAAFMARLPEAWKKEMEGCDRPQVAMAEHGPRYLVQLAEVVAGLTRIPLALAGKFVKGAQRFAITRQTLADVVANFRRRAADTVIDYEHASEHPEVAAGGPVPAAGWLKAIDDAPDADGVLWGQAEFTPRAAELVKSGEYRYLSPVIDWGARDKRTGEAQGATLRSVALTNRPFLEALPAIAMSDAEWQKEIDRGDAADRRQKTVAVKKVELMEDRRVRVTMDDGETAVSTEAIASPKVVRLSEVKRDGEGKLDFTSLAQDGDTLIAGEVFRAQQAQGELDAAVAKGLITPAQRPFYETMAFGDLPAFRNLVKTMKPAVDFSERGLGGGDTGNLDEFQKTEKILLAKVDEKLKADSKLQYGQALKLVASENPELNRKYTDLSRRKMEGREE